MSMKKLLAEGSLEPRKTILGWDLNFDDLTAALTPDKFDEWAADIEKILEDGETTGKQLYTLVGRNGHTCQILQLGLHFQNCLRRSID